MSDDKIDLSKMENISGDDKDSYLRILTTLKDQVNINHELIDIILIKITSLESRLKVIEQRDRYSQFQKLNKDIEND